MTTTLAAPAGRLLATPYVAPTVLANGSIAFRAAASFTAGAGATNFTVSNPAGMANNDLLIAVVAATADVATEAGGWTRIVDQTYNSGARFFTVWWKRAQNEPASWTWSMGSSSGGGAAVIAIEGANWAIGPIGETAYDQGTSTTPTAPSVTPHGTTDLLVMIAASTNSRTFTAPSGMTERAENGGGPVVAVNTEQLASGSATGTRAATLSSSNQWAAVNIVVRD